MNILILNWKDIKHPEVGGAEIIVYELARRLAQFGHQVTWFCRSFPLCQPEEVLDGVRVVRRGNLVTMYLLAPLYYWSLPHKPDLVIDISNTIYWQSPLWAHWSKKIAYLNQLAKEVFYYEYPPLIRHFGLLVERLQYLTYARTPFLCYAQSTKDDLISMGIHSQNIHTFSLGVDHSRYHPGKKSPTPLFICVNRLVKMKRTDLAIRAMAIVHNDFPKTKLAIIGTGYDKPRLEKLRDDLGLQSSVIFIDKNNWFFGKNPKDIKIKLMQQAWALIFPSVKEGWGMTVTECAACGTPAIVTNVSGLKDSVIPNRTGLVVSAEPTVTELAAAMIKIAKNQKLRHRLSRSAETSAKTFTWEHSFSQFHKLITNV